MDARTFDVISLDRVPAAAFVAVLNSGMVALSELLPGEMMDEDDPWFDLNRDLKEAIGA